MKGQSILFSKESDLWRTPPKLFGELNQAFGFTLDFAANAENHLCPRWFGPGGELEDALTAGPDDLIGERVWCNPPYSACYAFVEKIAHAHNAHQPNFHAVMLLPARTDTKWWHQFIWDANRACCYPGISVRFLKGRVKFERDDAPINSAPFPSVIVVFS